MSSELQYSLKEAHVNTCALFFRVFSQMPMLTQPPISGLHALYLRSWPAVRTVILILTVSNRRYYCCHSTVTAASQSATLLFATVNIASEMHVNALRSLTQSCLTAYCIWCSTSLSLGKRICFQSIKEMPMLAAKPTLQHGSKSVYHASATVSH